MANKPPVLFLNSPHPQALERLSALFTVYNHRDAGDKATLLATAAPHVRGVFCNAKAWLPNMLDVLPKLEIIACSSTGYDNFDTAEIKKRGMRLSHSTDLSAVDVSNMGMALMLSAARRIPWADHYVRSGDWMVKGRAPMTQRVSGKKLGIVGLGAIGRAVARRAAGFDMEISYQGPNCKDDVPYRYYDNVVEMASAVDFLMLSCIGGPTTTGIADAAVFKALGPTGIIINIARGSCVDQPALLAALRDGTISGAGLDAHAQEPQDPVTYEGLKNVVLTPHSANGTPDGRRAMFELGIANLLAHFSDRPLLSPVPEIPN